MDTKTKAKRPQVTPNDPAFMVLEGRRGPSSESSGFPDIEFDSVEGLRAAHKRFAEEVENLETLRADVEALTSEKTQLIAGGAREARDRLRSVTVDLEATQGLIAAAEDRVEASEREFRAMLHSAWQHVRARASQLRQPLIEERAKQLAEHPVIQSAALPEGDRRAWVRAFAESWPPLRMLDVWTDDRWKSTLSEFEDALKWVQGLEKNPSKIEDEPSP